ncbi:MAG: MarR family transcriptional regulator [Deltaproteobacteria bacterium]|nr:MarR family transcriptional regulator [Deltaproteobacteria bacterium]
MDKDLCYKLNYLARLLLSQVNDQMKPHGVTQGQLPVLCCLYEDEGQTQAELCKNIQVEQPTMANTLRRMERDGLIYRVVSEHDKRQSQIFITDQTRPIVEVLQVKRDEVVARMTRHMSGEELETFNRLLDSAVQALIENQTNRK